MNKSFNTLRKKMSKSAQKISVDQRERKDSAITQTIKRHSLPAFETGFISRDFPGFFDRQLLFGMKQQFTFFNSPCTFDLASGRFIKISEAMVFVNIKAADNLFRSILRIGTHHKKPGTDPRVFLLGKRHQQESAAKNDCFHKVGFIRIYKKRCFDMVLPKKSTKAR